MAHRPKPKKPVLDVSKLATKADLARVLRRIEARFTTFEASVEQGFKAMAADLNRLTTEVSENESAIDSAITLLNGLSQMVRDLAPNAAAIAALADKLDAKSRALAEAVVANTPSAEDPPPA